MKRLFGYLMIVVLLVSQVSLADYIIVGKDSGTITRFTNGFTQVWQTKATGMSQVEVNPGNGDVYVGYTGDVVKQYNYNTGAQSGNTGAPYVRKDDLQFGHDYNGDGVGDMWTVANQSANGIQVFDGTNISSNLASFTVADTVANSGTGGRGLLVGPDINSDGVGELFTVRGWNDATCRINVWDAVALKNGLGAAAQLYSWSASSAREPIDIILGPDFNSDGKKDLWISSQYGNNLLIYDSTTGAELGNSTLGGLLSSWRQPRPLDIANGPDGTILITTRFATSLDPAYVAGAETKSGNLLQYDPSTGATTLLYASTAIGRFDSVTYIPEPATMALLGLGSMILFRRKK